MNAIWPSSAFTPEDRRNIKYYSKQQLLLFLLARDFMQYYYAHGEKYCKDNH
jgi:hypothetical protein